MGLVIVKCTECGASIKIDETKKAMVCEHCGNAFIVQDAIKNNTTNITNNTINNVKKAIIINTENNKFDLEKNQCEVLLIQLKNLDFSNIKNLAIRILENNPNNSLAKAVYSCNFSIIDHIGGNFSSASFRIAPLIEYFKEMKGSINIDFCNLVINLVLMLENWDSIEISNLIESMLDNIDSLNLDKEKEKFFYTNLFNTANNKDRINKLNDFIKKFDEISYNNVVWGIKVKETEYLDIYSLETKILLQNFKQMQNILTNKILEHMKQLNINSEEYYDKYTTDKKITTDNSSRYLHNKKNIFAIWWLIISIALLIYYFLL